MGAGKEVSSFLHQPQPQLLTTVYRFYPKLLLQYDLIDHTEVNVWQLLLSQRPPLAHDAVGLQAVLAPLIAYTEVRHFGGRNSLASTTIFHGLVQPFDMLAAERLDQGVKFCGSLLKPGEGFFVHLEMFRIACLDVGLVENVVPCAKPLLVARPDIDQTAVAILRKSAQKFEIVRSGGVVGERQQITGGGSFHRLVKYESRVIWLIIRYCVPC